MNPSIVGGIVRAVLSALAGYLAGRGIDISGLLTPEVSSGAVVVGTAVWSIFAKRAK